MRALLTPLLLTGLALAVVQCQSKLTDIRQRAGRGQAELHSSWESGQAVLTQTRDDKPYVIGGVHETAGDVVGTKLLDNPEADLFNRVRLRRSPQNGSDSGAQGSGIGEIFRRFMRELVNWFGSLFKDRSGARASVTTPLTVPEAEEIENQP